MSIISCFFPFLPGVAIATDMQKANHDKAWNDDPYVKLQPGSIAKVFTGTVDMTLFYSVCFSCTFIWRNRINPRGRSSSTVSFSGQFRTFLGLIDSPVRPAHEK